MAKIYALLLILALAGGAAFLYSKPYQSTVATNPKPEPTPTSNDSSASASLSMGYFIPKTPDVALMKNKEEIDQAIKDIDKAVAELDKIIADSKQEQ